MRLRLYVWRKNRVSFHPGDRHNAFIHLIDIYRRKIDIYTGSQDLPDRSDAFCFLFEVNTKCQIIYARNSQVKSVCFLLGYYIYFNIACFPIVLKKFYMHNVFFRYNTCNIRMLRMFLYIPSLLLVDNS